MSWPVIVYIAAPIGSLLLLAACAWRVYRRVRSFFRDVQGTGARAAMLGNDAAALLDQLPPEFVAPMGGSVQTSF